MKKEKEKTDLTTLIEQLSAELRSGKSLTGANGVFTPLMKKVIEASLEGELDAHLKGESKETLNRRNGYGRKNLLSSVGGLEIFTPRDRNGSFEPQLIKKRQRRVEMDIDKKIISLYGRGMSYSDIQDHLQEMYDVELSVGTLTSITDRILPEITEWQQRPLDSVYPVMWLDAMHFKVRENGKVISKAVYSVLGVNTEGEKQVIRHLFRR
jgi:putative transposase